MNAQQTVRWLPWMLRLSFGGRAGKVAPVVLALLLVVAGVAASQGFNWGSRGSGLLLAPLAYALALARSMRTRHFPMWLTLPITKLRLVCLSLLLDASMLTLAVVLLSPGTWQQLAIRVLSVWSLSLVLTWLMRNMWLVMGGSALMLLFMTVGIVSGPLIDVETASGLLFLSAVLATCTTTAEVVRSCRRQTYGPGAWTTGAESMGSLRLPWASLRRSYVGLWFLSTPMVLLFPLYFFQAMFPVTMALTPPWVDVYLLSIALSLGATAAHLFKGATAEFFHVRPVSRWKPRALASALLFISLIPPYMRPIKAPVNLLLNLTRSEYRFLMASESLCGFAFTFLIATWVLTRKQPVRKAVATA